MPWYNGPVGPTLKQRPELGEDAATQWPIDANFCPCCTFYSTNNETLNNHMRKHYGMGLTCCSDWFTTASMAAMKGHMETEHGYEGKHAGVVKKPKGEG